MTVPLWLASIVAGAIVAQLLAGIAWAVRADRLAAVQASTIERIAAVLDRHEIPVMHAQIEALKAASSEHYAGHERNRQRIDDVHKSISAALRHETPSGGMT